MPLGKDSHKVYCRFVGSHPATLKKFFMHNDTKRLVGLKVHFACYKKSVFNFKLQGIIRYRHHEIIAVIQNKAA